MLAAPHHSSMHGLHLQQPAFGLIVRAVMRWLEEHMMSEHLRCVAPIISFGSELRHEEAMSEYSMLNRASTL